ncbi:3-deoxy-D-manno-octulosonate 8-phosphate phosphatase (KDO 8-P phosphatase) [Mucilaginibacter oryzae]|uniref:3-deoxy-D-manno-octulosonate 8-phosphate phosphatase (KDO 8-P phosphatase) n=1 Tax=Mucilaginibacter oryzae TaxID=468058 RepID=A0A316HCN0_9SPHI|nr:HAD-IIIA family hydrolase [Mucilaginibacter oryzae]PWK77740.1 3-deoxy-D-manno-octulosonate 8-phosphate phosphatase (KDO 8-P phosphatase) [Mucilaginibacter oryzae]
MSDKFNSINTFILDVDGVLTDGTVYVGESGEQLRGFNIKDGYAIQLAVKCGYNIAIITGAKSKIAQYRLNSLGVFDVFIGVESKTDVLNTYATEKGLNFEQMLYMGDDIPDLEVIQLVGLPACPSDAAEEIKDCCNYISPLAGGKGCVRDVIEKVLKSQGKWMGAKAYSW